MVIAMDVSHSSLSLEQQFNLRQFETQAKKMSLEQAQQFLVTMYEQMLLRDNAYRQILKKNMLGVE